MRPKLNEEWAVGDCLGEGGFGAVFEARSADGKAAAVKLAEKQPGADRELLFTDLEGTRNIVPVIDSGEHENDWVQVMQRAPRHPFEPTSRRRGPWPWTRPYASCVTTPRR
ncbi:hypothetical protein AB0M57_25340 [Streptomyces sp. NPDC051597]|uniref:hypothetical protein n=1 Tax=Streptomyces sp. NPDC051597 TaxID=3155049 RepID=UPI00341A2174